MDSSEMKVEEDFFAKVEEDCLMNVEGDCSAVKVEGDSSLRCSGQKLKRESDVLQNPEKCCRLTPKNILSYLPDDLIGRILFSGYLNKLWYNTICLVLVCKKFKEVGRTYIAYIKSTHMITMDAETLKTTELEVLGIGRIAPNLVYLDLSFCKIIQFDGDAGAMLLTLRHTLRGLSLRGTKVDDAFLGAYISQLSGLRFLDISKKKSMDKELVTDLGVLPLVYLKNLKWLNLSMCNITDMSISALCASVLHMEHIALFSCRALTDASLKVISTWKLHTLDISNCAKLTLSGLSFLINPRAPVSTTLVNLAASYLPNISSVQALTELLKLPKLHRLEFRKIRPEIVAVSAELVKKVREQLEVAILEHEDQLRFIKTLSIIEPHPPLTSLCPVLHWPYATAEF